MKNNFTKLVLIIAVLFIVSCKKSEKPENKDTTRGDITEETVNTTKTSTGSMNDNDIPNFNDPNVQEYVNSYEDYITEYTEVVDSKDMTSFSSLAQKGQELGIKSQEILSNLSEEDVKKLNDYMQKKSVQLQALSKKLMQ